MPEEAYYMITDLYRIKTQNSVYEIRVNDQGLSRCRKNGKEWRNVRSTDIEYLEKLIIGPSFDIPGVCLTSRVQDYEHWVPSTEPKRTVASDTVQDVVDHAVGQIGGQAVLVKPKTCQEPGCTYPAAGPSHNGSRTCKSGSIASGGTRTHCSCDACF